MPVKIPSLSGQIKANTVAMPQTHNEMNMAFQDVGTGHIVDTLKGLGEAAIQARENYSNGRQNGTANYIRNELQALYDNMSGSGKYYGYNSKKFLGDFNTKANEILENVRQNGYDRTNPDNTTSHEDPLSEQEWKKVLFRADDLMTQHRANIYNYSAKEIAEREKNDYNTAIAMEANTIVGTSDPAVQNMAVRAMLGLNRAYYRGRMSEQGLNELSREQASKALDTYITNKVAIDPVGALEDMKTNSNFTDYEVPLQTHRANAIKAAADIAGLNDALVRNGQRPISKNVYDEKLRALLTPQEFAGYATQRAEVAEKKSATIAKDVRTNRNEVNLAVMEKVAETTEPAKINKLIEDATIVGDPNLVQTISMRYAIRENDLAYRERERTYFDLGNPDGTFNEAKAREIANARATQDIPVGGPADEIARALTEERQKYANNIYGELAMNYERSAADVKNQQAIAASSSKQLDEVYRSLYTADAPVVLQDIPNLDAMTYADQEAAAKALENRAVARRRAKAIEENEGPGFSLDAITFNAWKSIGHKKTTDKPSSVDTTSDRIIADVDDIAAYTEFSERFQKIYANTYDKQNSKLDDAALMKVAIQANSESTFSENRYADVANRMRVAAYNKTGAEPNILSTMDAVRRYLSLGAWGRWRSDEIATFNTGSNADIYQQMREVYSEATPEEQDEIVNAIATGNGTLLNKIMTAKGL